MKERIGKLVDFRGFNERDKSRKEKILFFLQEGIRFEVLVDCGCLFEFIWLCYVFCNMDVIIEVSLGDSLLVQIQFIDGEGSYFVDFVL